MSDNPSKSLEIEMTAAARINDDLRDWIAAVAGPRGWGDTRESWLGRAARRLDLPARRVRALFYGEARRIDAAEYLTIKARAQNLAQAALETAIHAQTAELAALATDRLVAMAVADGAADIDLGQRPGQTADAGEVMR